MKRLLLHKLLSIPVFVWGLQLLYVAIALGLFAVLWLATNGQLFHVYGQVLYVLVMAAVNIAWRVTLKKLKPEWF